MILHAWVLLVAALQGAPAREAGVDEPPPPPFVFLGAEELTARGERLLDQADRSSVGRAEGLFAEALRQDPNWGPAEAGLARWAAVTHARRFREDDALVDEALDHARRAVALAPQDPRAHGAMALAAFADDDAAAVHEAAGRAWTLGGHGAPPWVAELYAQCLSTRRQTDAALAILAGTASRNPGRFQTYHAIGNVHLDRGDLDQAGLAYRRALALDPDYTPSLLQIALVLEKAGDGRTAARGYREIIQRFPEEEPRVYARMAAALMGVGRYAEALEGLEKARFKTRRGLGEGTVLHLKARCLEGLGRHEEARGLYRQVIQDHPLASFGTLDGESIPAASYEGLARLSLAGGDRDEAVKVMEEASEAERPDVAVFVKLTRLYADYGLHDEALRILRRGAGLRFPPRQAGAKASLYVAWARALRARGSAGGADLAAEAVEALRRDAGDLEAHGDLLDLLETARALALLGRPQDGVAWIRRAVEKGYGSLDWIARDEEMAPLTREPAFQDLRRRLAAPPSSGG
jgi:tetratricopeptide (TPR) repeat protein